MKKKIREADTYRTFMLAHQVAQSGRVQHRAEARQDCGTLVSKVREAKKKSSTSIPTKETPSQHLGLSLSLMFGSLFSINLDRRARDRGGSLIFVNLQFWACASVTQIGLDRRSRSSCKVEHDDFFVVYIKDGLRSCIVSPYVRWVVKLQCLADSTIAHEIWKK